MRYAKEHPEFITITCLDSKHILKDDDIKEIIIDSLHFLSKEQRIVVSGFVINVESFSLDLANIRRT